MKEIMYRAWNKKTKQMEHVLLICFVNKYVDVLPERNLEGGSQESWGFEDIELMQYTGMKDKNNKNIYHGDLIKSKFIEGKHLEVVYDKDTAAFKLSQDEYYFGFLGDKLKNELEVVGNIYQTPAWL